MGRGSARTCTWHPACCLVSLACLLLICSVPVKGALTVGSSTTDNMVKRLRQSIFVETAYLEERPVQSGCASLDGPACLAALLGADYGGATKTAVLDGPGVIPEVLLHDLGEGGPGKQFEMPEYDILELFRRQGEAVANQAGSGGLLGGEEAQEFLLSARQVASAGVLHFSGMQPDRRLPLTFSQGLPSHLVATWDGRWIVRDCLSSTALEAPGDTLALAVTRRKLKDPTQGLRPYGEGDRISIPLSAELAGSIGYLRFSHPVSVRSIFARWEKSGDSPVAALIGGRLGLESIWTNHLDPDLFSSESWVDVGGGPMDLIDEVVFVAAKGLHIGAIEVISMPSSNNSIVDAADPMVMMLHPTSGSLETDEDVEAALGPDDDAEEQRPRFTLGLRALSPAMAPSVASLQEVVDNNLRLREEPLPQELGRPRGEQVPGLLSFGAVHGAAPVVISSEAMVKRDFISAAAANEALFHHRGLAKMTLPGSGAASALAGLHLSPPGALPDDLRRQLSAAGPAVAQAVRDHVNSGGWKSNMSRTLPQNSSEDALRKYILAKERQTKLDLLTATVLYLAPGGRRRH